MEITATRTFQEVHDEKQALRTREQELRAEIKSAQTAYKRFNTQGKTELADAQQERYRTLSGELETIQPRQTELQAEWMVLVGIRRERERKFLNTVLPRLKDMPTLRYLIEDGARIEMSGDNEIRITIERKWGHEAIVSVKLPQKAYMTGDSDALATITVIGGHGLIRNEAWKIMRMLDVADRAAEIMDREFETM